MTFEFVSREPRPDLARFADSIWFARGQIAYQRERIAPTGSTVAVIVLGSPIRQIPDDGEGKPFVASTGFLAGPHDRPVVNEPTAETYCVGIVSTPVGCEALFGIRPATIRGRVIDLESSWPPASALRIRLSGTAEPERMLDTVTDALAAGVRPDIAGLDRCETAVAQLVATPELSIADLAGELGVSHGHLDREFVRIVGLTPRMLARILRLRRLLEHLDVFDTVAWSKVAAELGWYDQAHLIRDFKRHTGVTPSEYVASHRGVFGPDDAAAGFVPEHGR